MWPYFVIPEEGGALLSFALLLEFGIVLPNAEARDTENE